MKYALLLALLLNSSAMAAPDFNRLANAISKAENSKVHPYGVMVKYKHTTPRQACINTCKHAWKDYKGPENGFLTFLAARYAAIGAANDPTNLNKNWLRNVTKFYNSVDK